MNIYLIAYHQNKYQRQRILDFVKGQYVKLVKSKDGNLETILSKIDKVWVILPEVLNPGTYFCDIYKKELKVSELRILVEYFRLNQDGLIKKVKREELIPPDFEATKELFRYTPFRINKEYV